MNLETISSENLNKKIAYLLGVYLSDGSITLREKPTPGCTFSLQVIDRDFAEKVLRCLKAIMPKCNGNLNKQYIKKSGFSPRDHVKYCIGVGFSTWGDTFFEQTGFKHHIPSVIWEAPLNLKKEFIAGVLDGDGWIAIATKGRINPRFNIGIGGVEEGWIWEFKKLIESLGVKTNKPEIIPAGYKNHKVPFVRMKFNTRTFISAGLYFTMERKQKKLKYAIKSLKNIQERHYTKY